MKIDEKNISKKESISVEFFFNNTKEKFKLRHVNEQISLSRRIFEQNLHRPGLPLAGFLDLFSFSRVQVFGNTEMKYLEDLTFDERVKSLERIFKFAIPCVMITNDNHVPAEMLSLANQYEVPIFVSPYETTKLAYLVSDFLDDQFSPRLSIHGSFVDVYGVGMLFVGKSGIGKSEVALDLVERGHRLVADDVVILTKKGEGILMGSGTELVKHFMEIRGIGIIDIRSMFGVRAIRYQKRLEVIIELEIWDTESDYTRTGLDTDSINVMDVEMPLIKLPILPGKNITVVSEIIALNYLLKHYGYDAAKVLQERITSKIQQKTNSLNRSVNYFEHDFE
ncbi:MAG: HPr kinase/phosphorylase [Stygiobacter sp.]|nr:MAG: HPr(Ser) kinase/phosphatase [Stygiobacter sp. GWC2_38_9]OGV05989.1 MAG: HPr(Ser) kinase/phosphatase [Stygiobacter sp. RIFOXYB2_FULL_37_11]OGV14983.1 MAG: HPr(Ser) kinase/phosphatase [Stygiobacter sp. RIFOXYA2_FULL_38_8]OGV16948.1 MAG: HPr(Ser) kinase/phosphatase [Stygiobacter sp. RIFOXYC2_FULL_38_25]OGV82702.1 MAG: HPr(Ser) kinase/phosphatase [Stygiobacter sp. GWF2_38_21]RJQ60037.1 MAG: HPr kinase/phosphorylase [Stygiobacter sp.]